MLKIYTNTKKSWRIPSWGILMMIFLASFIPGQVLSQDLKLIKGTVTEASNGQALPGVSVKVKGTTRAVSTNNQGQYSIQAKNTDILVFSFVGSKTQEITVGARTTVDVKLIDDAQSLNETVIIGYGSTQKKDLTGSVGIVNMADLIKAPVGSFTEALAGRIAGVQVSAEDGQPGSLPNITIRGAGSLTQSTSPLYVIDGFPIEDPEGAAINPEEIESMTILKDASSTAIYGARGANGVIVIQTKRGKTGKPLLSLNSTVGVQEVRKQMELMSPYEFVKYQLERANADATLNYLSGGKTLDSYRDIAGVDWADAITRKGLYNNQNISLRGGNEQTKYSISGSLYDSKGIILNTGWKRYQGRVSLDHQISKKIKTTLSGNFSNISAYGQPASNSPNQGPSSLLWFRTWAYRPVGSSVNTADPGSPPVDITGEDADTEVIYGSDIRIGPVTSMMNTHHVNASKDFNINGSISYAFNNDLTLKVTGTTQNVLQTQERFYNSKTPQGSPLNVNNQSGINGSIRYIDRNIWSNENTLSYNKVINKDHNLDAVIGLSLSSDKGTSYGYSSWFIETEGLGMSGLDNGVAQLPVASSGISTLTSYFGRLNYNYKSKYLLTASFRGDGSSKFSPENRWGYFSAGAIAWSMHNEPFMKSLPFISNSKIRLSYGTTGNNRVGDFDYYDQLTFNINGYSFNNETPTAAALITTVSNLGLKWETTKLTNIAYDLGLFKNRVELTAEWYKKITSDLLFRANLPTTTGYANAIKNIGELSNTGIELSLNTINIRSKTFTWSTNFNISFNKNKILALQEGQELLQSTVASIESQFGTPLYVSQVGKPAGMMYGYIWDGNYQYADFDNPAPNVYLLRSDVPTNGLARNVIQPGDIKYKDLNGDGIVNTFDQTIIGNGQPLHFGGFSNNFSYKGFDLNVFFQWSYGNDIYNYNRLQLEGNHNGRPDMNQFASYVNRWSPENQTNENYRAGGQGVFGYHSDRVIEDGSYLRLKTLQLGYTIPARLIQKLYLSKLSLNLSAQNLITWTKYSGMDPEVSTRSSASGVLTPGFDYSSYPHPRTLVFGINASF